MNLEPSKTIKNQSRKTSRASWVPRKLALNGPVTRANDCEPVLGAPKGAPRHPKISSRALHGRQGSPHSPKNTSSEATSCKDWRLKRFWILFSWSLIFFLPKKRSKTTRSSFRIWCRDKTMDGSIPKSGSADFIAHTDAPACSTKARETKKSSSQAQSEV